MRITAITRDHIHSVFAVQQVSARYGNEEIDDNVALTVASWYASSGTAGRVLAQLATTGTCVVEELLDDIHASRPWADTSLQHKALDMLATWALNHPSVNDTAGCTDQT